MLFRYTNNDEDVELLGQDLVDVTLEAGRSVGKTERHDLVLEVAIPGSESRLPFVTFAYLHSMISVRQAQLSELFIPT